VRLASSIVADEVAAPSSRFAQHSDPATRRPSLTAGASRVARRSPPSAATRHGPTGTSAVGQVVQRRAGGWPAVRGNVEVLVVLDEVHRRDYVKPPSFRVMSPTQTHSGTSLAAS
jgi:hypothetical protein